MNKMSRDKRIVNRDAWTALRHFNEFSNVDSTSEGFWLETDRFTSFSLLFKRLYFHHYWGHIFLVNWVGSTKYSTSQVSSLSNGLRSYLSLVRNRPNILFRSVTKIQRRVYARTDVVRLAIYEWIGVSKSWPLRSRKGIKWVPIVLVNKVTYF